MSRRMLSQIGRVRPAWWVLILSVATAGVWQRFEVMRNAREVEQAQVRINDLRRLRDRLLAECSMLASRERIERIAVEDLGMSPTTRAQKRVLYIDTTSVTLAVDH